MPPSVTSYTTASAPCLTFLAISIAPGQFSGRQEVFSACSCRVRAVSGKCDKIKTEKMDSSIAARVKSRSKRKWDDAWNEENACGPSLGERVLFCKLTRDGILRHFNPNKLTDLRYVLELRCFKGLLSDEDLRECYFKRVWGYRSRDFLPGNWREMSVKEMQDAICRSVRLYPSLRRVFGTESYVRSLRTRDDIFWKYGLLRFVPWNVCDMAAR